VCSSDLASENRTVVVDMRCAWCRQDSLHQHAVGLSFENISDAQSSTIQALLSDAAQAVPEG